MRCKLGDKLTINGDWLYDWAKINQLIIGYDEILLSKIIDTNYKENMITYYFLSIYIVKNNFTILHIR